MKKVISIFVILAIICASSSAVLAARSIGSYYRSFGAIEEIVYPTIRYPSVKSTYGVNNNEEMGGGLFNTRIYKSDGVTGATYLYTLAPQHRELLQYYSGQGNTSQGYKLYMHNLMEYGNFCSGTWCPDNA